ncbi:MAG: response regulator [Candidatus Rokubacteria bacterium]|nr:response regulator [Candidatus Rokubacteria bacterium]
MTARAILVVEDNPITRKVVRLTLQGEGYTVVEAPDGRTALEIVATTAPDLILQDLLLPDMDGLDLVRQVRALPAGAGIPVLAFSGFLPKIEEARTLQAGFTDYLFKPIEPSLLAQTVRAYLPAAGRVEQPGRGRRILLVDDDPVMLKLMRIAFENQGFATETARDGLEALDRAREAPPDAIVSDVLMPRLDGFRLALTVRQDPDLARLPVVLVSSAYLEDADRQFANAIGASAYVVRTHDFSESIDAVLAALHETPRPAIERTPEELTEAYSQRIVRQLERQVGLNLSLASRLSVRQAELSILAGIDEALRDAQSLEAMLYKVLDRCLDSAGVSRGAVYLLELDGRLSLGASFGYPDSDRDAVERFFGHADMLRRALGGEEPLSVPSATVAANEATDVLDRAKASSILLAPVIVGGERLGVLVLASGATTLQADWTTFVMSVANRIGHAVGLMKAFARVTAAEERYRNIFEHAVEGMFQAAPEGRLLIVNPAMARMFFHASPAEMVAATGDVARLFVNATGSVEMMRLLGERGIVSGLECEMRRCDGASIWVAISVRAVRDERGRLLRLEGMLVDITERRRAEDALRQTEEQLRQAQKLEAIGQLAGGIAHDFNNLLTVILGRARILQDTMGPDDPARRHLDLIHRTAERAAGLSRQLLAFSRKQPIQPRVLDVSSVVTSIAPMLRRLIGEDVELAVEAGGPLWRVRADIGQLEQIVINLVVNARDAMPGGGHVVIETANVELGAQEPRLQVPVAAGRYVRLAVTDSGTGMSAEVQRRIFEPFFTTKEPGRGTGLGLSTVYGIVKQHEGTIAVDSEVGRGTRFEVYLPAVESAADVAVAEVGEMLPRGGETLLLVEDEDEVRSLAREILQVCGYTVLEAANPAEALRVWNRQGTQIHLVVTDVVMPGMSGRELAEHVRRSRPDLPVLFVSGYAPEALGNHAALTEIGPLLEKPFTPHGLATRVRAVLDAAGAS